jgi:phosphonate transport system substrate-binding protein
MMSRQTRLLTSKLAALFALVLLALSSCGKKSSIDDTRPDHSLTPSTATFKDPSAALTSARETTLLWGTIADNPQEELDKLDEWGGFLKYMAENLSGHGITDVKLVFCHSPQEMADWLREGKVDLFDESPFAAYLVHRLGNADEPLLNRWKYGNETFGSVIFSRKDGGPTSLDELVGKMIAFRGDTSTANYFRPKAYLVKQGYKLVEKKNSSDPVAPDEIGYFFAWSSRDKVVETVIDGSAAAGGLSDEFVEQLLGSDVGPPGSARHPRNEDRQPRRDDLRILVRVPPVLRRLVTVRKDLDPKLKAAIKEQLLGMHGSAEGRAVLATFGPSSRFSVADTAEVAYQGILDQGALVEQEIEKFRAK